MSEIEDRIAANTQRHYWRRKFDRGEHIPTRQLYALVCDYVAAFKDGLPEECNYDRADKVAQRWLDRNFIKIMKQAEAEERGEQ